MTYWLRRTRDVAFMLALALILTFAGLAVHKVWERYSSDDVPLVKADPRPYKVRPQ